jgi:endonuclease/exonuclease/phosphatase family metal-dependent hydrolase
MWTINVCTYNIMTPVTQPLRYNGQMERLTLIPEALHDLHQNTPGGLDVLIIQELIPSKYHRFLKKKLALLGWTYCSHPLYSSVFSSKLVGGGVVIFSRHPILDQKQKVFECACTSTDCLASKGVVYCKVQLPSGNAVSVVATHFQAWATQTGAAVRREQAEECRSFIDSLGLQPSEAVLFAGDLNTDYYTQQPELAQISKALGVQLLSLDADSHPFTSDPNTNAMVGNDDAEMYSTRLYPSGCYEAYMQTLRCPCCPQELLDYMGFSLCHQHPVSTHCQVVMLKTPQPIGIKLNVTTERMVSDLSDHYPLVGTFQWSSPSVHSCNSEPVGVQPHLYVVWPVAIFLFVLFVLWLVWRRTKNK